MRKQSPTGAMWLAQAYEPDRLGRVRLPSFWSPRPVCNLVSSPWVLTRGINKQMTITLLLLLGSNGFLFKTRAKQIASNSKATGAKWYHHLWAWSSALSEAIVYYSHTQVLFGKGAICLAGQWGFKIGTMRSTLLNSGSVACNTVWYML